MPASDRCGHSCLQPREENAFLALILHNKHYAKSRRPRRRQWFLSPEGFRELRHGCFMNREACAQFLGVSLRTVRYWEAGRCRVPWSAVRLLRLHRLGDLGALHDAWAGWTLHARTGELVSPNGYRFEPGKLALWPLLCEQARFWRQDFARRGGRTSPAVRPGVWGRSPREAKPFKKGGARSDLGGRPITLFALMCRRFECPDYRTPLRMDRWRESARRGIGATLREQSASMAAPRPSLQSPRLWRPAAAASCRLACPEGRAGVPMEALSPSYGDRDASGRRRVVSFRVSLARRGFSTSRSGDTRKTPVFCRGSAYFSPTTVTLTVVCTSACRAMMTSYSPVLRIGPSPWITSPLWTS